MEIKERNRSYTSEKEGGIWFSFSRRNILTFGWLGFVFLLQ